MRVLAEYRCRFYAAERMTIGTSMTNERSRNVARKINARDTPSDFNSFTSFASFAVPIDFILRIRDRSINDERELNTHLSAVDSTMRISIVRLLPDETKLSPKEHGRLVFCKIAWSQVLGTLSLQYLASNVVLLAGRARTG